MAAATICRVAVEAAGEVAVVYEPALPAATGDLFILAHGAGGHRDDRSVLAASEVLRSGGFDVARFNFPYREHGSARPDAMPVLVATLRAVAARVAGEVRPRRLILGGRSMGGRAASMLLAQERFPCEGLLLLAYPLHPAGQPEQRRDAHLSRIAVPVLCFSGTRDALCQRDLMERAVGGLPRWTQHWLDGADHSFHVLKRSGRTDAEVLQEMARAARAWADALPARLLAP